jgi:hypothetical protein
MIALHHPIIILFNTLLNIQKTAMNEWKSSVVRRGALFLFTSQQAIKQLSSQPVQYSLQ